MKIFYNLSIIALLLTLSVNVFAANAKLICTNNSFFWRKAQIDFPSQDQIEFTILAGNGMGGDSDIGKKAILSFKGNVNPNGRIFAHYQGQFEQGASQKTISLYLSVDHEILTQYLGMQAFDWFCKSASHAND